MTVTCAAGERASVASISLPHWPRPMTPYLMGGPAGFSSCRIAALIISSSLKTISSEAAAVFRKSRRLGVSLLISLYSVLHVAEGDGFGERLQRLARRHELVGDVARVARVDNRAADGRPVQ